MKRSHLVILGLAALVLAVGVMLKRGQHENGAQKPLIEFRPAIETGRIVRIELFRGEEGKMVELTRIGSVWTLPDFWNARADQAKVLKFLGALEDLAGELRSSDKALFDDYGISRKDAFHMRFHTDHAAEPVYLLAGTVHGGQNGVFIRSAGSADVFYAPVPLTALMGLWGDLKSVEPQAEYWLSKQITHLDVNSISEMKASRFREGKETVTFQTRKDAAGVWTLVQPEPDAWPGLVFKDSKIREYLGALTRLEALQVLPPEAHVYGLDTPDWILDLRSLSGETLRLTMSSRGENGEHTYLKVSSEPALYEISGFVARRLDEDAAVFAGEDLLHVDPAETSEVVFHSPERETVLSAAPEWSREDLDRIYPLRLLRPAALLPPDSSAAPAVPAPFWIRVTGKEGQMREIHFAAAQSGDADTLPARLKDGGGFLVSAETFQDLFEKPFSAEDPVETVS